MKKVLCFLGLIFLSISLFGQTPTGTLKIFSELQGIVIYLNEIRQGDGIQQISSVPVGSHYLKVMKEGVVVFGEVITITENTTTTVLVKNTGQVAEKILDSKFGEQEEYKNNKLDIILTTGSQSYTTGYNTYYPGYYSYWGTTRSVTSTVATTDWKIIKGGIKEISDYDFAVLTKNESVQNSINAQLARELKRSNTGFAMFILGIIPTGIFMADMLGSKPFLPTKFTSSDFGAGVFVVSLCSSIWGYLLLKENPKSQRGYISVEDAAVGAQEYNRLLKESLNLPESYEPQK